MNKSNLTQSDIVLDILVYIDRKGNRKRVLGTRPTINRMWKRMNYAMYEREVPLMVQECPEHMDLKAVM
jgi:hypothetical protein